MTAAQARPLLKHLSRRPLSTAAHNNVDVIQQQRLTNIPPSAYTIPSSVRHDPHALKSSSSDPAAVIRSIGTSRRVFLLHSSLKPDEIDGLAYRIRTLSSNDGINSIVVANPLEDAEADGDMSENSTCLPYFMEEGGLRESLSSNNKKELVGVDTKSFVRSMLDDVYGERLGVPYVCAGYDARHVYNSRMCEQRSVLETALMKPVMDLCEAMRGDYDTSEYASYSKVPVISLTHGL